MKIKLVSSLIGLVIISLVSSCNSRSSEDEFKYEVAKQAEKEADNAFKKGEKEINITKIKRSYAKGEVNSGIRNIPYGCSSENIQRGKQYATQMLDNKKLQKWRKREIENKCIKLRAIIQSENAKRNKRQPSTIDFAKINAERNLQVASSSRETWFEELSNRMGKSFFSEQKNMYKRCVASSKDRVSTFTEEDCFLAIRNWAEAPWSLIEETDSWTNSKSYFLKSTQPNYPKSSSSILQSLQVKEKTDDYEISFKCDAERNVFQLKTESLFHVKNSTKNTIFFGKDARYLEVDIKIDDELFPNVRFTRESQVDNSNPKFVIINVDDMNKILNAIENKSIMKIRLRHALIDNWKFNDQTFERYVDGTESVEVSASNGSDIVIQVNLFGFISEFEKTRPLCLDTNN